MRPRFRLRATYFSHGRKVGKSPHRGSASDSTWSQGRSMLIVGHPPMYPRFTGEQNWCVTLPTGAQYRHSAPPRRAPPWCHQTCRTSAPPMGAWCGCSSLRACASNGAHAEVHHHSRRPRRRKLHILRFRRWRKLIHSAAAPLPTKTAVLGFCGGPISPGQAARGVQMPKHTDAGGRRPSWEPAQPRVKDAGKRRTQCN